MKYNQTYLESSTKLVMDDKIYSNFMWFLYKNNIPENKIYSNISNSKLSITIWNKIYKDVFDTNEPKVIQLSKLVEFMIQKKDDIKNDLDKSEGYSFFLNNDNIYTILLYLKKKNFYSISESIKKEIDRLFIPEDLEAAK